jgi:hypothetical protein
MTANELTKSILEYCRLKGHYVFRVNNIPGTKYRANTLTKGIADILGCTKQGLALAIEVKIGKDRQSEYQKEFEEHYKKRGGIYIVATKLEDVTEKI